VVYKPEAAIIRCIYRDYAAGKRQRQIERELNDEGVPAQQGGEWHQGTIARVVANPIYKGHLRHVGQVYAGQHEAIISAELWEQVRQTREAQARTEGGGRGRHATGEHLFQKRHLRCGRCGSVMIPRTAPTRTPGRLYEVYRCYGHVRDAASCPQQPVRRELIDGAVWSFFEQVALDVDATKAEITTAHEAKLAEIAALREQADRQLAQAQTALLWERPFWGTAPIAAAAPGGIGALGRVARS
jgi:predicted RNA-binding Zn-ribbon protein involved in translation (DUF1610 family)